MHMSKLLTRIAACAGEGILRGVGVLPLIADASAADLPGGGVEGEGGVVVGAMDEVEELHSMVCACPFFCTRARMCVCVCV
jgi:hypothetical protein